MKKWNTTQQMANEITDMDVLDNLEKASMHKELNGAQGNHIAAVVKRLYEEGGKDHMIHTMHEELKYRSPEHHQSTGLTMNEKFRAKAIVRELFKYHWFPLSRIRRNMKRLGC